VATQKQIEANRANASKSTGPRTPAGKAAASRNALKHGLLAQSPLLPDEDSETFNAHTQGLFDTLQPAGTLEVELVGRIACLLWRLARAARIEVGVLTAAIQEFQSAKERETISELERVADSNWLLKELRGTPISAPDIGGLQDNVLSLAFRRQLAAGTQDEWCDARGRLARSEAEREHGIALLGRTYKSSQDMLAKLSRYETSLDRSLGRALDELRRLQALRYGAYL